MDEALLAELAQSSGQSVEAVRKVLEAWRTRMVQALGPGGEGRVALFDLASLRVTTEPVGPVYAVATSPNGRTSTATMLGVYARMVLFQPQPALRAVIDPIVVSERAFEGVFDHAWHKLKHALGTAEDVPFELWHLASKDDEQRRNAMTKLSSNIVHKGTVYEATARAIPYLVRLATDPQFPNRSGVLDLFSLIAKGHALEGPEGPPAWWAHHVKTLRAQRDVIAKLGHIEALADRAKEILKLELMRDA
jgi:hypothetical protein